MAPRLTAVAGQASASPPAPRVQFPALDLGGSSPSAHQDKPEGEPQAGAGYCVHSLHFSAARAPVLCTCLLDRAGSQAQGRQACCLPRQAILSCLTFPLMSFCEGIK